MAPTRRVMEASLGKMPTTSARRLTSLFRRSSGLVECNFCQWALGKAMKAITSASANAAALPSGAKDLGDGGFQALVSVGYDELHPFQAALFKAAQKAEPKGGGFRSADSQAGNPAPPVGVDARGDYRGD